MSVVTIMYDVGDSSSMGPNNIAATANRLSSPSLDISKILSGSLSDEEVVKMVENSFRERFGVTGEASADCIKGIEKRLKDYFKMWHEKAPDTINLAVTDKLIETANSVYTNTKKKTIAPAQTQQVTVNE